MMATKVIENRKRDKIKIVKCVDLWANKGIKVDKKIYFKSQICCLRKQKCDSLEW